jgi:hypothetical protein
MYCKSVLILIVFTSREKLNWSMNFILYKWILGQIIFYGIIWIHVNELNFSVIIDAIFLWSVNNINENNNEKIDVNIYCNKIIDRTRP